MATAMDWAFSLNGAAYTSVPAVASVASSVALGAALCFRFLFPHISAVECLAAAAPTGLTLSTWVTIVLKSTVFRGAEGLPPALALSVSLLQSLAAAAVMVSVMRAWDSRRMAFAKASLWVLRWPLLVLGAASTWFAYLHYTHSLLKQGDKWYVGGTVYGDMPFHLNIISSLLWGPNKHVAPLFENLKATFYLDAPLVYPYIADYHAASLVGAGSSLHFALFVPGALLCASFLYLLFSLNLRLTGSVSAGLIAVPLCVFAGGIGGFYWLMRDSSWNGIMRVDHVQYVTGEQGQFVYWFSLVAHILFPQRTTQFAYTVSLIALICAYRALESHGSTEFAPPADTFASPSKQNPVRSNGGVPRSPSPTRRGGRADPFMTPEAEQSRRRRSRRDSSPDITTPKQLLGRTPEKGGTPRPQLTGSLAPMPLDVMWLNAGSSSRTHLLVASGVFTGMLPLLQAHSFVAVGVIMIVVAASEVIHLAYVAATQKGPAKPNPSSMSASMSRKDKKKYTSPSAQLMAALKSWIVYGVVAFAVGLPQSTIYFAKAAGGQKVTHPDGRVTPFIRLVPLWHDQAESGGADPFTLWWKSLLYFVPLNVVAMFVLPLTTVQRRFQFGMFAVFLMSNIVIFQPWELDNTKVFYVWLFGASGAVAMLFRRMYNAGTLAARRMRMNAVGTLVRMGAVAGVLALCFTGFLCLVNETWSFAPMFDSIDVEQAVWINDNTPVDARFVTSTHGTHFRPASSLGGRALLTTYVGWVSNHGMQGWIQRNEQQNHLQAGVDKHKAWDTILEHNITHMVFLQTSEEKNRWDVNFLNSYAYRVASNGRSIVYKFPPREVFEHPKDCAPGNPNMNEDQCTALGCVWITNFKGPWCQVRPTVAAWNSVGWEGEATVSDCSHENINKRVCNQHGCSWFPGFNGPWCHEPLTVPGGPMHGRGGMPDLMADPVDCGGFSELMCADRGCNWEPKPNAPWCTKPKKDEAPNNPHTVHTDHAAGTNIPRTEAAEA